MRVLIKLKYDYFLTSVMLFINFTDKRKKKKRYFMITILSIELMQYGTYIKLWKFFFLIDNMLN